MDAISHMYARDTGIVMLAPSVQPYTTPALAANLVFRVVLGIIANLVCLVPLRLLYQSGEFAAVVFIVSIELKNLQTVLYALIWHDDNMDTWWMGHGLCDFHPYFQNVAISLFPTCMLAIMRNLSRQVSLMRAHPLSIKERRRKNLVQALIMFPLPVLQLGLTWFVTSGRYAIGTVVGCSWMPSDSWPYLLCFGLAPAVVSAITAVYAILTYTRYREVVRGNDATLSRNRLVSRRAQRARRRLYLMILAILVPYFLIVVAIAVINIRDIGDVPAYDYDAIHNRQTPFPWDTILLIPSTRIGFIVMNSDYISIITAIPIFVFFGMTKEALNCYRTVLVSCGLATCFPSLREEYSPDRHLYADRYYTSSQSTSTPTSSSIHKFRSIVMSRGLSSISSTTTGDTSDQHAQHASFTTSLNMEAGQATELERPQPAYNTPSYDTTLRRNPFLMRTNFNFPAIPLKLPRFLLHKHHKDVPQVTPQQPQPSQSRFGPATVHTRVWSEEDIHGQGSAASNRDAISPIAEDPCENGVRVDTTFMRETHDENQHFCQGCQR